MKANDKELMKGVLIGLLGGIIGSILFYSVYETYFEPKGIGGFVQREIDWADQTYHIMEENHCSFIHYDKYQKYLYCYSQDCIGEYCKSKEVDFPIRNIG